MEKNGAKRGTLLAALIGSHRKMATYMYVTVFQQIIEDKDGEKWNSPKARNGVIWLQTQCMFPYKVS